MTEKNKGQSNLTLGAGVIYAPEYEGSEDYKVLIIAKVVSLSARLAVWATIYLILKTYLTVLSYLINSDATKMTMSV